MEASAALDDIVSWLDQQLDVVKYAAAEPDSNGLLVRSNQPDVIKFAVAVNTSLETVAGAARAGAQLLVVHHTTWKPIDLHLYDEKIDMLRQAGISLYGAHASLDCAPRFGNAWILAEALALGIDQTFGEFAGGQAGVLCPYDQSFADLVSIASSALAVQLEAHGHAKSCTRVALLPGAGGMTSWMEEARNAGADTFLTGEGSMYTRMYAKEAGMNLILGTHYATEAPGIRALGRRLGEHTQLAWEFVPESADVF